MRENDIKANTLKKIMITIITIMIISSGLGFYFVQNGLKDLTIETNTLMFKAYNNDSKSRSKDNAAPATDSQIIKLADRTMELISQPANFEQKSKSDITKYAQESGITINSITLVSDDQNNQDGKPPLANGVSSKKMLVSIGSPAPFNGLLKFAKAIETNLPKMQITNMNLSNIRANKDSVTIEPITIEVYVK